MEKMNLKNSDVRRDKRDGRPRKVRGEFALPLTDNAENSIKAFLKENSDELQLQLDEKDLKVIKDVQTPIRRVVRYQQMHEGIPVFGATIMVQLDKSNRVKQLDLGHVDRVRVLASSADTKLTPAIAKKSASNSLEGHKLRQKIEKPEEIYFPTDEGLKLAYLVMILTDNPAQDWRVIVDAFSGEILAKEDLVLLAETGQGDVFDPNPVVTAEDNTYRDPNAAGTCGFTGTAQGTIDNELVTRNLVDITKTGTKYKLEGPYVVINNSPEESNKNNFKYTSDDNRFEAVNAYYHIDTIQRFIQSLGITTAHNSPINVIHHASQSYASYSPGDDTIRLGHSGSCRPDRGEDGEVMIHEYGHAIHHDQVPGWGGTNPTTGRNETGAMGEGFSDILACVFFAPEYQFQQEVFEDWIFGDIGGLRRVDGTKVYPGDWTGSVHQNGEIWSAALWNIYLALGGDSTTDLEKRQKARYETLKTVIQSHTLMATNGTMADGAEAFMDTNEEDEEFLGRHAIDMLDSFHDRGILNCESGSNIKITKLWSQQDDSSVRSWEQVEAGQDNWFYAEITNASNTTAARALVVTFNFKSPFATPVYPGDFRNNTISATAEFNLAPGETRTVKARWPREAIPAIPTGADKRHGCILAEIYNPEDHVAPGVTSVGASNGKLKQRNTDIVDLLPDEETDYYFDMSSFHLKKEELMRLEVIRPPKFEAIEISFKHRNPAVVKKLIENVKIIEAKAIKPIEVKTGLGTKVNVLDPARVSIHRGTESPLVFHLARGSAIMAPDQAAPEEELADIMDEDFTRCDVNLDESGDAPVLRLRHGSKVGFPYIMKPRERARMQMKIKAPRNARPGDKFTVGVVQRNRRGHLIGGFDIQVNVVKRK